MIADTDKGRRVRRVSLTLDAETAERLDRIAEMDRRWDAHSIGALLRPLLAEALRVYESQRGFERESRDRAPAPQPRSASPRGAARGLRRGFQGRGCDPRLIRSPVSGATKAPVSLGRRADAAA